MVLKFRSGVESGLLSSNESISLRALLEFSMAIDSLEIPLLHTLRSCLKFLNLRLRTVAEFEECTCLAQEEETTVINPGCCNQKDSNLKFFDLGIAVSIVTTHGGWSDTGLPKGLTHVFG